MFEKMDTKKLVLSLICIVLICFAFALAIIGINGGFEKGLTTSSKNKSYSINKEKVEKIDGINEIYVKNSSADINIIPEKRNDIKIHLYGNMKGTVKPNLNTKINNDKLTIDVTNDKSFFSISFSDLKLDIYIPESYTENLNINSSSGNINITKPLTLKNFNADLTSGDSKIKNLKAENLTFESSSGNITIENTTVKQSNIKATSGDIKINEFKGSLDAKASSGDVSVNYEELNNNLSIQTTSGDIEVSLPSESQFSLNSRVTSGDIDVDFPITINGKQNEHSLDGTVGNAQNEIILKASSGDITINKH